MDRRSFLAVAAASATATTVSAGSFVAQDPSGSRSVLARPRLARLIPDPNTPGILRLMPINSGSPRLEDAPADCAALAVTPLPCTEQRVAPGAGFDIEVVHPRARGVRSTVYSAHRVGVGAFPSAVRNLAHPDRHGRTTLVVTQRADSIRQSTHIAVDARRPGRYLLAVPTDPSARAPLWRASRIELSSRGEPGTLDTLMTQRSRFCALLAIAITTPQEAQGIAQGADHAS